MKNKKVVLCEFHEEDRLAVNVLHVGVCAECNEAIARLGDGTLDLSHEAHVSSTTSNNGNGTRKRRRNLTPEEKDKMRQLRRDGVPLRKVSEMFSVSPSSVTRYTADVTEGR